VVVVDDDVVLVDAGSGGQPIGSVTTKDATTGPAAVVDVASEVDVTGMVGRGRVTGTDVGATVAWTTSGMVVRTVVVGTVVVVGATVVVVGRSGNVITIVASSPPLPQAASVVATDATSTTRLAHPIALIHRRAYASRHATPWTPVRRRQA
jgi:hypothetical protein